MVERAAAGEAPSSPQPPEAGARRARLYGVSQPPEAGARRARLYGVSPAAENRNRQTMSIKPVRCRLANVARIRSADFKHIANLPLTAWRGLTAGFRAFDLPLTDVREDGAYTSMSYNTHSGKPGRCRSLCVGPKVRRGSRAALRTGSQLYELRHWSRLRLLACSWLRKCCRESKTVQYGVQIHPPRGHESRRILRG